jgi:hypothetical protein
MQQKSVWQNRITVTGAILAVFSVLFFISFQLIELAQPTSNPYTGLWSFLVLPAVMVVGLLLIPLGGVLERRRRTREDGEVTDWSRLPHFDPNDPHHRRLLVIFASGTLIVIPLIALSSYEGYHYTDSTQFCGQVCHSVMHPEYTTYQNSPHARVSCAECHIGPGASWFVKSKISGVRQVFAVMFQTYSRPIPTPVKDLRPARETCEQCHWPEKFFGSQLRTRVHYSSDDSNTRSEVRVLVKTGGGDSSMGPASGIHWHMALSHTIEYIATTPSRLVIPWVRATSSSGEQTVYRSDGKTAQDPPPAGELRRIDCMDCHNRPTHIIQPPDRAVNVSMETGRLDRTLPSIKRIAVDALTQPYSSESEADAKIETLVRDFYSKRDGQVEAQKNAAINKAIEEVRAIYRRNFFPRMRVDWRAYPDNIGHMIFDGCFRCHDGKHVSVDRGPIRRDCTVCHDFLQPMEGKEPPQAYLNGVPPHPVKLEGVHNELNCSACHTGGPAPDPTCSGCHTLQAGFRRGQTPALQGLQGTPPSIMADLDCDSCHDLSKPQTSANVASHCESCHDKGYGDMVQLWKDDVAAGRAKAEAAIKGLEDSDHGKNNPDARALAAQLRDTLIQLDTAVPVHNTDYAGAIYDYMVKSAQKTSQTASR